MIKPLSVGHVAELMGGTYRGPSESVITGFATDSRSVRPGDLFVAIVGENVDGHDFAKQAVTLGASAVLSERDLDLPHIRVVDVVAALASFGKNLRAGFHGPVIGITGSAGKTTTKEFVAAALGPLGPIVKTLGNQNTEYTNPLVWAEVESRTKAVVVEMAMRGFGQIEHLAKIASPTMGIVTNIGHSHLMQLGSRAGIAAAKGELLQSLGKEGIALIWREDDYYDRLAEMAAPASLFSFGYSDFADCQILDYRPISWTEAFVSGTCRGEAWNLTLPAVGRHMALNAAAAILAAKVLGVDVTSAAGEISLVKLPPMRMEVIEHGHATILLDTYNASPASMLAAIETVSEIPTEGNRYAVLGEMRELGEASEESHRRVGIAAANSKLDRIYFVGPSMKDGFDQFGGEDRAVYFEESSGAKEVISTLEPGDVLLIKGSRALQLEKLIS